MPAIYCTPNNAPLTAPMTQIQIQSPWSGSWSGSGVFPASCRRVKQSPSVQRERYISSLHCSHSPVHTLLNRGIDSLRHSFIQGEWFYGKSSAERQKGLTNSHLYTQLDPSVSELIINIYEPIVSSYREWFWMSVLELLFPYYVCWFRSHFTS